MPKKVYFLCGIHSLTGQAATEWAYFIKVTPEELTHKNLILGIMDKEDDEIFNQKRPAPLSLEELLYHTRDTIWPLLKELEKGQFGGIYWVPTSMYDIGESFDKLPADAKRVTQEELRDHHAEDTWWTFPKKPQP